jgi:hypothetical protein
VHGDRNGLHHQARLMAHGVACHCLLTVCSFPPPPFGLFSARALLGSDRAKMLATMLGLLQEPSVDKTAYDGEIIISGAPGAFAPGCAGRIPPQKYLVKFGGATMQGQSRARVPAHA